MSKQNLGKTEQALFERLRVGPIGPDVAPFFSRQIGSLIAAKIARRTADGGVELVNPAYSVAPPPTSQPPPAPSQSGTMVAITMPTVTARVPQEVIDYLDAIREENESRGGAIRRLLGAAVERGLGRSAVRKVVPR